MFAVALNLNLQEYEDLLNSATYSLPKNMSKYIILRYCFENKIYNIDTINTYLKTVCNTSNFYKKMKFVIETWKIQKF